MKRRRILLASVIFLAGLVAASTPTALRALAYWATRAAASFQSNDLDNRTFDSDGVRLRYLVEGTGEPVVLVHGFASSVEHNWHRTGVLDALVRGGFQVVAYDTRGHGRSQKPYDPAQYGAPDVRDIVRLLDHLGFSQAHLVGYSRGAMLSHHARQLHPERFLTVTLGGYGSAGDGSSPMEAIAANEVADSLERGRLGPLARALTPEGGAGVSSRALAVGEGALRATNDMRALAATFRAPSLPLIPLTSFRAVPVPTLILIGEHDPLRGQAERMAESGDNIELRIIPGVDHLGAPRADEFIAHLTEFLGRHRAATN
ncbi:MAG TPA: alpha/beta hydrolase [Gemmatimonadaceae bacterium]